MNSYKRHLILSGTPVKQALSELDVLAKDALLFVVDKEDRLLGSLSDGDIRRGLIQGLNVTDDVDQYIRKEPKSLKQNEYTLQEIIGFRERGIKILPLINSESQVVDVINLHELKSYLPIDVVIMAGGLGTRLKPLTDEVPKPLLKVGDRPIIDHMVGRLIRYGVTDFWISVRYKAEMIENHFAKTYSGSFNFDFLREDKPLGTIGSVSQVDEFKHDVVLVTNSDILTNLDYEDFYLSFIASGADMAVASIPYEVKVPYAVLELDNEHVKDFKEKPTYTYYSNAGIYLIKREVLKMIPKNRFFNSTDLMEVLINQGGKVYSYPLRSYWLDIGKHEDYERAQRDVYHLREEG